MGRNLSKINLHLGSEIMRGLPTIDNLDLIDRIQELHSRGWRYKEIGEEVFLSPRQIMYIVQRERKICPELWKDQRGRPRKV